MELSIPMSLRVSDIFNVQNYQVVITGGASGLGKILARGFVANGCNVCIVDIDQEGVDATLSELKAIAEESNTSSQVTSVVGDLSSEVGLQVIISSIKSKFSQLDVLVNCAGIRRVNAISYTPGESLSQLAAATGSSSYSNWESTFKINVLSPHFLTAGLVELLGKASQKEFGRGNVICFSSVSSVHNGQYVPSYQTSKASVDHLVRIMAAEFSDKYIRVNAISPGLYPSKMNPMDISIPESNMRYAREMPARRPGTEQELVSAAIFLASNKYVDGRIIRIDGGRLLVCKGNISQDD